MILISFLRSFIGVFLFIALTGVMSAVLILEVLVVGNRRFEDRWIQLWGEITLKIFNVKVRVSGQENIPQGACLFLFNHTSFFDIFAMFAAYPHFRFGAKIELFSIPIFGKAMEKAGALPIARQKREEVMKVYDRAVERVARGEKFALSPEGGRNYEEKLLPFKAGPFLFAINAKMPMVPVVIRGAKDILGKGQFLPNWKSWQSEITVVFLPAVSVESKTEEDKKELQELIFKEMSDVLATKG